MVLQHSSHHLFVIHTTILEWI